MLRVLDLFSGIGGFSLGLERTGGFRTVAFCEIEPFCRAVLSRHWSHVPCFPDVRLLSAAGLGLCGVERPDIICGGFPCQDISLAGKGAGLGGERSGLWSEMCRLLSEYAEEARSRGEPGPLLLAENVSALRSRGLEEVLRQLAEIRYDAEWYCIPAAAVGAPHRRDRIWIVAYDSNTHTHLAHSDQPRLEGWLRHELQERAREWAAWASGAFPDSQQQQLREQSGGCSGENGTGPSFPAEHGATQPLANTHGAGQQQQEHDGYTAQPEQRSSLRYNADGCSSSSGWFVEPDVGRVADGVPFRVDRLRALGNAVVPQIPEIIGLAILKAQGLR